MNVLIINKYILENDSLSQDEKIKLALKYQIFMKNTSLFAEVAFSGGVTEEMKLKF